MSNGQVLFCPLKAGTDENFCDAEHCAWWSEEEKGCSIKGIDTNIDLINDRLSDILELLEKTL